MKESHSYYTNICKNCGEDCDEQFCSLTCQEEWENNKADYDYEHHRDQFVNGQWGPL